MGRCVVLGWNVFRSLALTDTRRVRSRVGPTRGRGRKKGERQSWSVHVWWGVHGLEGRGFREARSEHDKYFRCRVDRFSASAMSGMRKRTPSMGKIVEVAPTDFLTLRVARHVLHAFLRVDFLDWTRSISVLKSYFQ
jgi:hypothetical protein